MVRQSNWVVLDGEVVLVGQRWLWWVDLCSSPAAPMNGDSAELNGIESVGFAE